MYRKELVALSLSFPHFRVNILAVILNYQSRDENLSFLNALILLRPLSYICSSIFRIIDRSNPFETACYKITKIVRLLWLAERRVCMRVCKHGCDIKMFSFSRANHVSTNLKNILSWKPRQVYFIHPFPRRLKLGKSLEPCCVNFFSLELTF